MKQSMKTRDMTRDDEIGKLERFLEYLAERGIWVPAHADEKLLHYMALIRQWNQRTQLVSRNDVPFLFERHIADSLLVPVVYAMRAPESLLDLGSGAGLPGIPLAVLFPPTRVVLVEPKRQKMLFLKYAKREMALANVDIIARRIEEMVVQDDTRFEIVVVRAVGRLSKLWQWSGLALQDNGALLAMKGGDVREEVDDLERQSPQVAVEVIPYVNPYVPAGQERVLVVVKR